MSHASQAAEAAAPVHRHHRQETQLSPDDVVNTSEGHSGCGSHAHGQSAEQFAQAEAMKSLVAAVRKASGAGAGTGAAPEKISHHQESVRFQGPSGKSHSPHTPTHELSPQEKAKRLARRIEKVVRKASQQPQAQNQSGGGLTNQNGAPMISASVQLSPALLMEVIMLIRVAAAAARMNSLQKNVQLNQEHIELCSQEIQKSMLEQIGKDQEAQQATVGQKILAWLGRIVALVVSFFLLVASVAAAIGSFGAGSPLVVAAAVLFAAAVIGFADQISQEAGGPSLSLTAGIKAIVKAFMKLGGMSDEEADTKAGMVVGALGIALAIVMPGILALDSQFITEFATSLATLAGQSEETAAAIAAPIAALAQMLAGIALAVVTAGGSLSAVAKGVEELEQAATAALKVAESVTEVSKAMELLAKAVETAQDVAKAVGEFAIKFKRMISLIGNLINSLAVIGSAGASIDVGVKRYEMALLDVLRTQAEAFILVLKKILGQDSADMKELMSKLAKVFSQTSDAINDFFNSLVRIIITMSNHSHSL